MTFYNVKRTQVAAGHLVDAFGSRVLYRLEQKEVAMPDGTSQPVVEEWIVSMGADGELYDGSNENDDEKIKIGTYKLE